jgi:hypothetical protein
MIGIPKDLDLYLRDEVLFRYLSTGQKVAKVGRKGFYKR